jgi:hypothetical protein
MLFALDAVGVPQVLASHEYHHHIEAGSLFVGLKKMSGNLLQFPRKKGES